MKEILMVIASFAVAGIIIFLGLMAPDPEEKKRRW